VRDYSDLRLESHSVDEASRSGRRRRREGEGKGRGTHQDNGGGDRRRAERSPVVSSDSGDCGGRNKRGKEELKGLGG
jgi:hypothetical protein